MRRALGRTLSMLLITACVSLVPSGWLSAEPGPDSSPQIVRIAVTSQEDVQRLAASLDVWDVRREEAYVVALVTAEERQALEAQGYDVAVDEVLTASLSAVAGYPCYRTMDELYAELERLAAEHPAIAQVYSIGYGFEGRPLVVARLTNHAMSGDKPVLFVMGGIHGRELITVEVVMAFAERLVERYGHDPDVTWILDHHEVHLLVSANPDGHARNETSASYWRKNTHPYGVCTYYGVDLNRNHTYKWNACSGCSSGDPCAWSYRGPAPGSEPEARAIEAYTRALFADRRGPEDGDPAPLTASGAFLTLHAYGNEVMWPWGWTSAPPPNADGLAALARKLARYNGYSAIPSWQPYYTDGTSDDWAYGTLGVAALTFEIGSSTDGMYPPCSRYDALVQPNLDALLYAARAARAPYLESLGPDAVAVEIAPSMVSAGEAVTLTALINDSATGGQAIAGAEYAVDTPWWAGGAVHRMDAADGALDDAIEDVTATVDTSGWAPGRHTLWVRGRDAAGYWGPPSAAWVTIEPDAALGGHIRRAAVGGPLAGAQVWIDGGGGVIEARANDAGRYEVALASGTYTVTAEAWGHASASVGGVSVAPAMTATADLTLESLALGVLTGRVIDAVSRRPLGATVSVDGAPVTTFTSVDGGYLLPLPAGSYTVTTSTHGHEIASARALVVETGRVTRHDVALAPLPPLLVVDDDYAGDWLWHDREAWHLPALDAIDVAHDLWPVKDWGAPSTADLAPYGVVLWLTGDARYDTLTSSEQEALRGYLEGGGALLLSGQHLARDVAADPGAFLATVLGAEYVGAASSHGEIRGAGPLGGLTLALGGGDGADNAWAPAMLGAMEAGAVAARYEDGEPAAVAVDGEAYRALLLGFGVEAVATGGEREALLRAALAWLGTPVQPDGLALRVEGPPGPVRPGDALQYALTLTNASPVTQTGIVITDTVPADLGVASAVPAATLGDGVIRWQGLTLPPGGTLEARYTAQVRKDVAPGATITNAQYGATSDQGAALAMSGAVRTLVAPAHGCSLSAPTTLIRGWAGETALVELRLTNEGLASDTYILSADGGPWVATLSMGRLELAPGESASPVLRVAVPAGAAEGETGVYTIRAVSAGGMDAEARSVAVVSGIVRGRIWMPALLRR